MPRYLKKSPRKFHLAELIRELRNRKSTYSLNTQIIGGLDGLIYDVDFRCPGSVHDATVWRFSQARPYIETRWPKYFLAGDSGNFKCAVLITPNSAQEELNNPRRRLFNIRLSGLRCETTECIFGRLKKRFPILRKLRCTVANSQSLILECSILLNICVRSAYADVEDDDDNDDEEDEDPNEGNEEEIEIIENEQNRAVIQARGAAV